MKHFIIGELFTETVKYFRGGGKRIQHFTKVYSYAALIGRLEGLDGREQFTLETASIVHDIGIKNAEQKYGECSGKLQEKEGPPVARQLLCRLGFDGDTVERVCYLVGNHHSYEKIDGSDFQILCEADLIVNFCEEHTGKDAVEAAVGKLFKTAAGKDLCRMMFGIE